MAGPSLLPSLHVPGHPMQGAASAVRNMLSPLDIVWDPVLLFASFPSFFSPLLFTTGNIDRVRGESVVTMDKLAWIIYKLKTNGRLLEH